MKSQGLSNNPYPELNLIPGIDNCFYTLSSVNKYGGYNINRFIYLVLLFVLSKSTREV